MAMSRPDGLPLHGDTFDYALCDTPTFTGDTGHIHVALAAFDDENQDFAFDPISTNQRIQPGMAMPVLGTVVVAGPTRESIQVLVPTALSHRWEMTLKFTFTMLWNCGWDRPLTWATNYPHRISPSHLPRIPWSRPWGYNAARTGRR